MANGQPRLQVPEIQIPEGKDLLEDAFWLEVEPEGLVEEEGFGKGKKLKLKGKIGVTDVATANRRVYPRGIIERNFARLGEALSNHMVYGELDHPGDGKTKLSRVSHFVTELRLEANGDQYGTLEFIPGTTNGDQAIAIARAGGRLGVSSRGFGTTAPDGKGNDVVQEDYQLVTFDIVADPAAANAHPDLVYEQKEIQSMDLNQLKTDHPELVEAIVSETKDKVEAEARHHAREALRTEFEERLSEEGESIRTEAVEQARSTLLEDPEVAGAKTAMDRIKSIVTPFVFEDSENRVIADLKDRIADLEQRIARQDETIAEMDEENEELAGIARELGHNLYLERELRDNDRAEQIIEMLGDVKEYESLDDLSARVAEVSEALSAEDEVHEEYEQRIAALEKQITTLSEQRDTALKLGTQFGVRAYIERAVAGHPKQNQLREHLIRLKPETKEDVEQMVDGFEAAYPVSEEYKRLHEGIEIHRARSKPEVIHEVAPVGGDVLGVSFAEVKRRSEAMP